MMTPSLIKILVTIYLSILPFSLAFSLSEKSLINDACSRRSFVISTTLVGVPAAAGAVPSSEPRNVDVGGGFDLLEDRKLRNKDVTYPQSMEGLWVCDRVVTQVEGDQFNAKEAWRALGGGRNLSVNKAESYPSRFMKSPLLDDLAGVVNDRGFEVSQRASAFNVAWNVEEPDVLAFDKIKLTVKSRSVEVPSDEGFGFNELIRIEEGPFTRVAQIKRRYRRAFDDDGGRVVEGLEIMKTFRVLDGIAGTEFPTSTVKSSIRMRRPS
jgi:hypothetical protein